MNEMENNLARRILAGQKARGAGELFEAMIETALGWYEAHGFMKAAKTPEPMKPLRPVGKDGRFVACYIEKAQVDFSGTIRGGRAIRFEAKQTNTDRFTRDRLTDKQMDDLTAHQKLGALCFVIVCFGVYDVYRIPWEAWDHMKERFGRKYVTERDLQQFKLPIHSGVIKLLDGLQIPDAAPGEGGAS